MEKIKKCLPCKKNYTKKKSTMPDGIPYHYYQCPSCKEEILDMKQLHSVAEKYRQLKKYHIKLNKWGPSLGIRLPKELAKQYKLNDKTTVSIIPQKKGLLVVPE
jgi:hypothetical protein